MAEINVHTFRLAGAELQLSYCSLSLDGFYILSACGKVVMLFLVAAKSDSSCLKSLFVNSEVLLSMITIITLITTPHREQRELSILLKANWVSNQPSSTLPLRYVSLL